MYSYAYNISLHIHIQSLAPSSKGSPNTSTHFRKADEHMARNEDYFKRDKIGVRIRETLCDTWTLCDIEPLNKVPLKRARSRVEKGPLQGETNHG